MAPFPLTLKVVPIDPVVLALIEPVTVKLPEANVPVVAFRSIYHAYFVDIFGYHL